ncbi:hypothetical protein HNQ36_005196 [Afipia massiliensis]|uniref:Uncharacterized protein n=1 Tax=Afipia massiliensis TaxID=211460 RepID=A0A840N488_9BRAD|nr:hypothetical protein [Afipia massiliensis]
MTSTIRPMFSSAGLRTSRPRIPRASTASITETEGGGEASPGAGTTGTLCRASACAPVMLAVVGLSALLMTSAFLFSLVKYAGAAYLIPSWCSRDAGKDEAEWPDQIAENQRWDSIPAGNSRRGAESKVGAILSCLPPAIRSSAKWAD